jgi:TRAP-type C4-dicarboxylate transport system permease small subunit
MNRLLAVNIGELSLGNNTVQNTFPDTASLVSIILKNSITVIGIILVLLLIYGGTTFIISAGSGDAKKADASKSIITNALIGFAVVFSAYFIIQLIEVITGLKIL